MNPELAVGLGIGAIAGIIMGRRWRQPRTIMFEHHIETSWTRQQLWDWIIRSWTNSAHVQEWPHRYNTITTDQVVPGSTSVVKYRWYGIPFSETYFIDNVVATKELTYSALPGHPFVGGGSLTVKTRRNGSMLIWKGNYTTKGIPIPDWYFAWFDKRFFRELTRLLSKNK